MTCDKRKGSSRSQDDDPEPEERYTDEVPLGFNREGWEEAKAWRKHRERQRRPFELPKAPYVTKDNSDVEEVDPSWSEPEELPEADVDLDNPNAAQVAAAAPEVWIIADYFVIEPYVGGHVLGHLPDFDVKLFKVARRLTQEQFDAECVAYHDREGHWPDT
jgi:hypothetical protein